jgi:hypothetical protein
LATDAFYPKASRYFAQLTPQRPIFQGDVFRGAFGAFWRHPDAVRSTLAGQPMPPAPRFPNLDELRSHVLVQGRGYGMLLPQPCEYADGQKGTTHPFRLVAPLFALDARAGVDHQLVRAGRVGHTVWVPRWGPTGPQDYFADLRFTTSIDAVFITPGQRVAALSRPAWIALADRLSRYFVGVPLQLDEFAVGQGLMHPDSQADAGRPTAPAE